MTEAKTPGQDLEPAEEEMIEFAPEADLDEPDEMDEEDGAMLAADEEFDVDIEGDESGEEFDVEIPGDGMDVHFMLPAAEGDAEGAASASGDTDAGADDESAAEAEVEADAQRAGDADDGGDPAAEFAPDDEDGFDGEDAITGEDEAFAAEDDEEPARAPFAFTPDADAETEQLRMIEALLFAAAEPLDEATLGARLPAGADIPALIAMLQAQMQGRGVELVQVANGWRLQTPADLAWLLEDVREERRKLSAAARETLAIIAYHQPVTRAEIEDIRGVAVSKGTVDMLMELGWVRMRGRRRAPGRPVTYGTTDLFLSHFGLESLTDLPGKAELKAAGLLDNRLPADFAVPEPGLFDTSNEDPLEEEALENAAFHVDFLEEGSDETPQAQVRTA